MASHSTGYVVQMESLKGCARFPESPGSLMASARCSDVRWRIQRGIRSSGLYNHPSYPVMQEHRKALDLDTLDRAAGVQVAPMQLSMGGNYIKEPQRA